MNKAFYSVPFFRTKEVLWLSVCVCSTTSDRRRRCRQATCAKNYDGGAVVYTACRAHASWCTTCPTIVR